MQPSLLDESAGVIYTPSDFIAVCNQSLEYAFPVVEVIGEVSGFKVNKGKFIFFDVKDDQSSVGCFATVYQLRTPVEDGMRVRIIAQPKLTQWGKFSLTVRSVRPVGEGSLKRAFEILKTKLEAEGLFDEARKRMLPEYPRRIAVVSSSEAAGFKDFVKILNNRWGGLALELIDVAVQGVSAPDQIVAAIEHHNQKADLADVLVLTRGGGSADDLAAFNDERVVRAISASRIPTIVAVGHEVDTSLADLAADMRASTPSNAAEIIVPNKTEFIEYQQSRLKSSKNSLLNALNIQKQELSQKLQILIDGLQGPARKLELLESKLNAYDPTRVLKRGYSLLLHNGAAVRSVKDVQDGDNVVIQLYDGQLKGTIND